MRSTKFPAYRQAGKHQKPNNDQYSMAQISKGQRVGSLGVDHWRLFGTWDLAIGI
jgi:hypothetical protein